MSDSEASRALRVTGIDQTFLNAQKQTTFFAPSDHAFAEMQDDRVGVRLLDRDNSRNLERVSVVISATCSHTGASCIMYNTLVQGTQSYMRTCTIMCM